MATPKLDIEAVLGLIETFIKANLNTKLAALDTEKSDGITLATIATDAYFLETLDRGVASHKAFIVYGIEAGEAVGIGPGTSEKWKIFVVLVLSDEGSDTQIVKRLLRYQRGLKEIFETSWASITTAVKFKIASLRAVPIELFDSSFPCRAIGIVLETTLA